MSDQILSQEEIDALLSSMDKGEVDLEEDTKVESHAESYDLTSQSRMLRDQFSALDEVYDKFTISLRKSLSSSLQRPIEVDFISMEMRRFEEFLKAFSHPTSFNIFNMEPLIGSAMLVIEANLVFSLIDCMFGGDGKPISQMREFTLIEQRMMRKFTVEVLKNLENSWKIIWSLDFVLKKTETKPEFIHVFAPNDLVIVVVFSMIGGEITGNIHLCIPYLMLESIKDKLSSSYLREAELENTWSFQLQDLLMETTVGISAELGRTSAHTVRDLLDLQSGDVIKFSSGPQGTVTVTVEGIPLYQGLPGVRNGNRAVQISALLRQSGGANKDG
jgi:flagellar motor switch protein FliM